MSPRLPKRAKATTGMDDFMAMLRAKKQRDAKLVKVRATEEKRDKSQDDKHQQAVASLSSLAVPQSTVEIEDMDVVSPMSMLHTATVLDRTKFVPCEGLFPFRARVPAPQGFEPLYMYLANCSTAPQVEEVLSRQVVAQFCVREERECPSDLAEWLLYVAAFATGNLAISSAATLNLVGLIRNQADALGATPTMVADDVVDAGPMVSDELNRQANKLQTVVVRDNDDSDSVIDDSDEGASDQPRETCAAPPVRPPSHSRVTCFMPSHFVRLLRRLGHNPDKLGSSIQLLHREDDLQACLRERSWVPTQNFHNVLHVLHRYVVDVAHEWHTNDAVQVSDIEDLLGILLSLNLDFSFGQVLACIRGTVNHLLYTASAESWRIRKGLCGGWLRALVAKSSRGQDATSASDSDMPRTLDGDEPTLNGDEDPLPERLVTDSNRVSIAIALRLYEFVPCSVRGLELRRLLLEECCQQLAGTGVEVSSFVDEDAQDGPLMCPNGFAMLKILMKEMKKTFKRIDASTAMRDAIPFTDWTGVLMLCDFLFQTELSLRPNDTRKVLTMQYISARLERILAIVESKQSCGLFVDVVQVMDGNYKAPQRAAKETVRMDSFFSKKP